MVNISNKIIVLILSLLLLGASASAQLSVSAQLDSTQINLGSQCQLTLKAEFPADQSIDFPYYSDSLMPGIEVVGTPTFDTVLSKNQKTIAAHYTLTSFQDTNYVLKPFVFRQGQDSFLTDSLCLTVIQPFELDSTNDQITDIKPVEKAPIWWWGILRWVLLAIVVLALLGWLIWYIIKRRRARLNKVPEVVEIPREPSEVALEALELILQSKVWERPEQQKEYYTELTDVIRRYIDQVWDIGCTEMPSSDILLALRKTLKEKPEAYNKLKAILAAADLAKFAKWVTSAEDNEANLRSAISFVNLTKQGDTERT